MYFPLPRSHIIRPVIPTNTGIHQRAVTPNFPNVVNYVVLRHLKVRMILFVDKDYYFNVSMKNMNVTTIFIVCLITLGVK